MYLEAACAHEKQSGWGQLSEQSCGQSVSENKPFYMAGLVLECCSTTRAVAAAPRTNSVHALELQSLAGSSLLHMSRCRLAASATGCSTACLATACCRPAAAPQQAAELLHYLPRGGPLLRVWVGAAGNQGGDFLQGGGGVSAPAGWVEGTVQHSVLARVRVGRMRRLQQVGLEAEAAKAWRVGLALREPAGHLLQG